MLNDMNNLIRSKIMGSGKTQAEIAKKLGISRQALNNKLKRNACILSLLEVYSISQLLSVNLFDEIGKLYDAEHIKITPAEVKTFKELLNKFNKSDLSI